MKTLNRFIAYTKRILSKKLYIVMLLSIVLLTVIYTVLPETSKESNIRVGVCIEDDSKAEELEKMLLDSNSIYNFCFFDSRDELLMNLKRGDYECGFMIPDGFFSNYIIGNNQDIKVARYTLPSSSIEAAITETLFSNIFKICAPDILNFSVNIPELSDILSDRLNESLYSDEIFTLTDTTSGTFRFKDIVYRLNIPVFEVSIILILFSSLLGLYSFYLDKEKGMCVASCKSDVLCNKIIGILSAILPIFVISLLSVLISYGLTLKLLFLLVFSIFALALSLLLSILIKRSTLLNKVLPITMLSSTVIVFVCSII